MESKQQRRLRLLRGLMGWDVIEPLNDKQTLEWISLFSSSQREHIKGLVDWVEDYELAPYPQDFSL